MHVPDRPDRKGTFLIYQNCHNQISRWYIDCQRKEGTEKHKEHFAINY